MRTAELSKAPLVSVVLPTYNRAHLLPRAITSVLGQSFRDFELLVVDDGSTDGTEAVVRSFADSRILFLPAERNLGDAGARNRGIALARGEWIAFQDSDDEWLYDKLDQQLAFSRRYPDADFIGGASIRIAGSRIGSHYWPLSGGADEDGGMVDIAAWLATGIANLQAILVRRRRLDEFDGFDCRFRVSSDADFVYRLITARAQPLVAMNAVAVVMHETAGSLVLDIEKQCRAIQQLLENHESLLREYPAAHAAMWYRLALHELQCGNVPASRRAAFAAITTRARWWRPWIFLGLTVFGQGPARVVRRLSQAIRQHLSTPRV